MLEQCVKLNLEIDQSESRWRGSALDSSTRGMAMRLGTSFSRGVNVHDLRYLPPSGEALGSLPYYRRTQRKR